MAQTLRWGILGTGNISYDFVRAMSKCDHKNVVTAVGGRSQQKAKDFVAHFGLDATAHRSYQDVVQDPNVDVVYVGLANEAHAQWSLLAMDHGKHVLCEKPLAVNAREVQALVQKAKEKNVFLMEPPSCHSLEHGSTPLVAIGVYPIQFALWVFRGERPRVTAVGGKNAEGSDVWANVTLDFPSGGHALLYYNSTSHSPCNAFVGCEKGHLQIPDRMFGPTRLVKVDGEGKTETFEFPLKDDQQYNYPNSSGLRYEADHVYECIVNGAKESKMMPLKESQLLAEILDAVRLQIGVVYSQDA
ncbi:dihydrodiol dehydrogenase (dimeric)like protein [Aphelenchoides avenae]|nr:dihydrodiol dehydrogenase (dimeric)like protein [Aphelenchus avenae]